MKKHNIPLGKIIGIPVGLDYSWFLIFALLTWSLAVNYFPGEFKNWPVVQYWIIGAVTAIMLFVSVLLHEIGHSVLAMFYKIKVKQITLFLFGGVAEIVGEPPKASAEFWIAIAGPIVSFLLAGIFYLIGIAFKGIIPLYAVLKYLAYINFALAIFNLIPGFPLDGGRVFRAIIWGFTHNFHRATYIAVSVGRFIGFIFIFLGALQIFGGNVGNGIWIAFIGWFLESAAMSQLQQQNLQDHLLGHTAFEAMTRDYGIVPDDTTIQEVIDNHILGIGRRSLFVKQNEKFIGLLTLHRIKNIPREKWETTSVTEAMIPDFETEKVEIDFPVWDALLKMDKDGVNQLPVVENGKVIGILSRESIITFLGTQQEFRSRGIFGMIT
ncbi:MAG: site-2 protease family protein [Ignavibacteriaceae bacterium]